VLYGLNVWFKDKNKNNCRLFSKVIARSLANLFLLSSSAFASQEVSGAWASEVEAKAALRF